MPVRMSTLNLDLLLERFLAKIQAPANSSLTANGLPMVLESVANEAMEGSRVDNLFVLAYFCQKNKFLVQYPQIVKPFFHYLNTEPPLRFKHANDWHRIELAVIAFEAILAIIAATPSALYTNDCFIMDTFTHSWPAVWKWMKCLHSYITYGLKGNHCQIPKSITDTVTMESLMTILRIVSRFFVCPSTPACNAMEATPGLFLLLVDIWIRSTDNMPDSEGVDYACALGTMAILELIKLDASRMKLLVDVLHGDLGKVASLILTNIRAASTERKEWMSVFPLIAFVTRAATPSIPGLSHALLSQNAMVDISDAFADLSFTTGPQLPEFLSSCLDFFDLASVTADGFTWIIQAIRSGLIQAILRSAPVSTKQVEDDSIKALVTVQKYLVYRSVLRAVVRALQDPDIPHLESEAPLDGRISKYWAYFKFFVKNRLEVKLAFDQAGKYTQTCFALECNNMENGEGFRLCSACLLACYCSEECQRRDWKSGKHRTECRTLRKDRADGVASPISPRDEAFFLFLSSYEMKKYREQIIKRRDESLAANPASQKAFILYMNHATIPPAMATFSYPAFRRFLGPVVRFYKPSRDHSNVLSNHAGVADMASSTIVDLRVTVPYGAEQITVPFRSPAASSLFGWHHPKLIQAESIETESAEQS